ncbi:MAG: pentapeptide repeat-containing protein [Minicystis sp.]
MRVHVLFISANVPGQSVLDLEEEERTIREKLRHDDRFVVTHAPAARVEDLQTYLRTQPAIVHFGGHGTNGGGTAVADDARHVRPVPGPEIVATEGRLLLRDDEGRAVAVAPEGLARLFEVFGGVRCAVLNACFSEAQAEALAEHVDVVIGTRRAIEDKHAITFTNGFYEAIGAGDSIEKAFEVGRALIEALSPEAAKALLLLAERGVPAREVRLTSPTGRRRARDAEFLDHVERICRLRHHDAISVERHDAPHPFGGFLEVATRTGRFVREFPVAAVEHAPTRETLDAFMKVVAAKYRARDPGAAAWLVHHGAAPAAEILDEADRLRVDLVSFAEYQGLVDFTRYLAWQTRKLDNARAYPRDLYVEQRATVVLRGEETAVESALDALTNLLDAPHPRFVLVLADFGTGKTFLLHQLTRRLAERGTLLVPVLVEMRALEKAPRIDALIAQHLANAGVERIDLAAFRYMLAEGRVALLFDGFDELALRLSYDRVAEHFDTLAQAAEGNAKIVVTSRTQHFLNDKQIKTALAERADRLQGSRVVKIHKFEAEHIRRFLERRLGDPEAAQRRFELLGEVRDLRGLAENPRLLSFIVEIDEEDLRAAKEQRGAIGSATLYEMLIERWLGHEIDRAHPRGAVPSLDARQRWRAVTALAMRLWATTDRAIDVQKELSPELCEEIRRLGPTDVEGMEPGVIRHQVGSGTLLVRDEAGRFSFLHQSVLEWVVAWSAAAEVRARGKAASLTSRAMTELMVDFFCALAGADQAKAWAEETLSAEASEAAAKNALAVLACLDVAVEKPLMLAGQDLRGRDFSGRMLRKANLAGADLRGVKLVGADLQGATLVGARLAGADLSQANLVEADLSEADLTSARLIRSDLRRATVRGAVLRYAALMGAQIDSGARMAADGFAMASSRPTHADIMVAPAASAALCVCMSLDGVLLASGHGDGTVRLWDTATGTQKRILDGHADRILSVAFSPDGFTLAAGSGDRKVRLWDTSTGTLKSVLDGHGSGVQSVAFSPDGLTLASGSSDAVCLWDTTTGTQKRVLDGHGCGGQSVAFSPDGLTLAAGSGDKKVRLWDTATSAQKRVLVGHFSGVLSVAFSPDGLTLASGSYDEAVRLWDAVTGTQRGVLDGHGSGVLSVAFSPDGLTLASGSGDKKVRLWDTTTGTQKHVLDGHGSGVLSVSFSPDGGTLASGSYDEAVRLWDTATGTQKRTLDGHADRVLSVAFSPDGLMLASGSGDKEVRLWDTTTGTQKHVLDGHGSGVQGVAFSPDGLTLASGAYDNTVRLWDTAAGTQKRALVGHTDRILSVAFAPDGLTLASGSYDDTVRLWDTATGTQKHVLDGHERWVYSVAFAPDGLTLASGSYDDTVCLWDSATGRRKHVLRGHESWVRSVTFSPDGLTLASGSDDRTVRLWDTVTGTQRCLLKGHKNHVLSVAFSPDGLTLASGSHDKTVRLWDTVTGTQRCLLEGHKDQVLRVAFSPDGLELASASKDGTIRLWSTITGEHLATLLPRSEGWAAVLPDGRFKMGGDIAGAFWHVIGLVRFEPGELDPYLPHPLRIPDDEPLLPDLASTSPRP